jgi:hypothetical protein
LRLRFSLVAALFLRWLWRNMCCENLTQVKLARTSVGVADRVEGLAEVVGERVGCGGEGFITMSATRHCGGFRR